MNAPAASIVIQYAAKVRVRLRKPPAAGIDWPARVTAGCAERPGTHVSWARQCSEITLTLSAAATPVIRARNSVFERIGMGASTMTPRLSGKVESQLRT